METTVLLSLMVTTAITGAAPLIRTSRRMILLLTVQAAAIGFVELVYCITSLVRGLALEALVDFFYVFAEWFSCTAVIPSIIYLGVVETEDVVDEPTVVHRKVVALTIGLVAVHVALGLWLQPLLPPKLETLLFCTLMFCFSTLVMATRRDSIKILVGLNMAENALYPLLAEGPIIFIPFILGSIILVNLVAVFVIVVAYRSYGTLLVTGWRWPS